MLFNNIITDHLAMLDTLCDAHLKLSPGLILKLAKCGIKTMRDLLFHRPLRYLDKTHITPIASVVEGRYSVIQGQIIKVEVNPRRRKLTCHIEDDTGTLCFSFFHFYPSQVAVLKAANRVRLLGEVTAYASQLQMVHPEYQCLDDADNIPLAPCLTPVYPVTDGLSQKRLSQLIQMAITHCRHDLMAMEWMNETTLEAQGFIDFFSAVETLHAPPKMNDLLPKALARLAFDELLAQQISLALATDYRRSLKAYAFSEDLALTEAFIHNLPFPLTGAQQRVYKDIARDLALNVPMLRLVQGDVGCGKTVIAALAALQVIAQGAQVALMTPTDILSEQHMHTFKGWFKPLNIGVYRLSGQMSAKYRKEVLEALRDGSAQLIIGTHALFQDIVTFHRLGLVIVDEQHRFGVTQRLQLQQKGDDKAGVHQLFMTATPIPRTLAMMQSQYMDMSIIDEKPCARKPIQTVVMKEDKEAQIIERLAYAVKSKKQVYWVCPLIDVSEAMICAAATERFTALQRALPTARIGLMHGRLKALEKEKVMAAFKAGDMDILVATLVIEVGVDVPNANIIVIESAERLGLAQLHQLRGRVGRGQEEAYCLLLYKNPLTAVAKQRLAMMRETDDGFLIAEKDLILRGIGDVLGIQQTGYCEFKCADLHRDKAMLPEVLHYAQKLTQEDVKTALAVVKRWRNEPETVLQG